MSGEMILGFIAIAITVIGFHASAVWWASALYKQVSDMALTLREMKTWLIKLDEKHNDHETRITVIEERIK